MSRNVQKIGAVELVDFPEAGLEKIPAKVDTGADSSAIWASKIRQVNGKLTFLLFDKKSEFFDGKKLTLGEFRRVRIRNANDEQVRYKVKLIVKVNGRKIRGWFTLADRSGLKYPVLIGRRLIKNKFIVDVGQTKVSGRGPTANKSVLALGVNPKNVEQFFYELSAKTGCVNFLAASLRELLFWLDGVNTKVTINGRDIAGFGLVYFKTSKKHAEFAAAAAKYLAAKEVKFIDRALVGGVSYDKLTQIIELILAGIAVPKTVSGSSQALLANLKKAFNFIGLPLVAKEINQDRGRRNYLLRDADELEKMLVHAVAGEHFLLQKYVNNDGYLRLYVFGEKLALAVNRTPAANRNARKAHLNNPPGGDNAKLTELSDVPAAAKALAIQAAKCLNRQVAGVDLIYDLDQKHWLVLEVNSAPQLRTGSFTTEKLAAFAEFIKGEVA